LGMLKKANLALAVLQLAFCSLLAFLLSGCPSGHFHGFATPDAMAEYAKAKAVRLAECQAQELTRQQAEKCLGEFAVAVGSDACQAAWDWMKELPE